MGLIIFALLLGHLASTEAAPNVIFILVDDVGWADFGYNTKFGVVSKLWSKHILGNHFSEVEERAETESGRDRGSVHVWNPRLSLLPESIYQLS